MWLTGLFVVALAVMTNIANPADWTPLKTSESLFCAGHGLTSDGTIIIAGGYNEKIVGPTGGVSRRILACLMID